MWDSIVLNAAAVSRTGKANKDNGGNFFLNGQSMTETDFGNVRTSLETSGTHFMFAVCQDLGNHSKDAATTLVKEIGRIHNESESSSVSAEARARQLQECFDVTSNLTGVFESTKKPVFAGMAVYGLRGAVYTAGKGSVIISRGKVLSVPTTLTGFDINVGDMFLLTDRILMEVLGEEAIIEALDHTKSASDAAGILYAGAVHSDYEDDINIIVVKAVKIQNDMPVGVTPPVEEEEDSIYTTPDYSKKLTKFYDKKQETFRTIIASILTVIILVAVVFTIFKILTSETNGIDPSASVGKSATAIIGATSPAPGTSVAPSTTVAPTLAPGTSATPVPNTSQNPADYTLYTVKSGDSLSSICTAFYQDSSKYIAVAAYNNIPAPYNISIGQVLKMPKNP